MIAVVNSDRLENGAARADLAEAAAVLFSGVLAGEFPDAAPAELPWLATVAVAAGYMEGSGDEGIAVSIREVAGGMRRAFLRAAGEDDGALYDGLPPLVQLAWEATARFLVWAVQSTDLAGDGLAGGLSNWGQLALAERARRGL